MAVGLIGSEDPADPLFMDLKGRNLLRVLHFLTLKTGLKGLLKSLWTCSVCVFMGHSGGTATCENSQQLTTGFLKFKVTGVFTAFMPSTAVYSCWRAISMVMVPPRDRFLSPVYDG